MQTVTNIFSDQLDMHWHENDWFASLEQALDGVSAPEASWTSSGKSNSIWQIVNHLIYWNEDVIHRIKGTKNPHIIKNNEETFANPGDPEDENGWVQTLQRLNEVMNQFKTVIAELDDEKLKAPYAANSSSIERLISSIMMHDSYHIGQIVLLRKLQSSWGGVDWS
ncbi:DinB family protein [Peribacillus frigoritolerans]|uniref:DinB family protein n=1 Tax=Peribacillus frigoritolerans TaxID=450367 RepID=UPI001059D038|nr:DinB family protein [Peribacillus frigoritolerans]TDL77793.1 DinB family protein [Peribacillus frigoritolerans]